jgi:hypothetical protein
MKYFYLKRKNVVEDLMLVVAFGLVKWGAFVLEPQMV